MATLINKTERLLTGPKIPPHAIPRWAPGENKLDLNYWNAAKRNGMIKVWLQERYISVDTRVEPKAADGPTAAELAVTTSAELAEMLIDAPKAWAVLSQAEIDKRAAALSAPRENLAGLRIDEALPLIASTIDTDTLERWADADDRKGIADAIDDRLGNLVLGGSED